MAGAVTLAPVDVASAADSSPQTRTITGHFDVGVPDFVYLPVQVPSGVRQLDVSYGYDRPAVPPGVPGNALDIGIFDQRGHELGDHSGFRGWSGGFRDSFSISNSQATPGYLPGPIEPGTWNVVLGPYTVAPAGLNWTVQITLTFGERGRRSSPTSHRPAPRVAGAPGIAGTATCTRSIPTAGACPPRSPPVPAPASWTSSSPRTTTPRPRTGPGASSPATTC